MAFIDYKNENFYAHSCQLAIPTHIKSADVILDMWKIAERKNAERLKSVAQKRDEWCCRPSEVHTVHKCTRINGRNETHMHRFHRR